MFRTPSFSRAGTFPFFIFVNGSACLMAKDFPRGHEETVKSINSSGDPNLLDFLY